MNMLIKEIAKKQFAKVYWYLILGINKVFYGELYPSHSKGVIQLIKPCDAGST